ncbi:hypothetical protein [Caballeronia ptereochthonis]|uniref:Uncharacterized protein n=1 Tax=Caballeronia ptereochthonis TaxID=1777144 RepID=A0A157ZSE4_9BURK|nr:hypothetical protein [Caballeronia ptereochthonis]SAK47867.1 hypothetical protein AWB83_00922 [Caballeronia ptereochthonis]
MNQVIVGVFGSYRDGHEALRALQLAGLRRDDAHLYMAGRDETDIDALLPPAHDEDDAEYVAHGEHQGVIARNRFVPDEPMREPAPRSHATNDDATPQRTLLVIRLTDEIKAAAVGEVLHEHGAIAVKDPSGHWRFSPYKNAARV